MDDRSGTSATPPGRRRHRDRHGRGMRGPIAPPRVPLAVTRAETFHGLVEDSADRLRRRLPQLARVEFEVLEVPPAGELPAGTAGSDSVPLGGVLRGRDGRPDRILVYRRPIELRSRGRDERSALVHEVVVEQAADLLGLAPESVDPRYGEE
ncbi:hypothetical protein FOE67_11860 [Streptomyces calidiresistens]|uniref:Metallopeptidase family protein n=2 Tax=Streptomyces calidiresistens TaxID=1485586 RepID=A0A7W3T3E4_9ACTN|nr:metallopeptidase family protein [Streptomyces calidiresistens]MBB0230187.1 hypothetical protein [Streptomyces calidiresistens]